MTATKTKITAALFAVLLLNTAYIAAFADATIFYMTNVLAHLLGGLVFTLIAPTVFPRIPAVIIAVSALTGLWLAFKGATFDQQPVLWAHIVISLVFVA